MRWWPEPKPDSLAALRFQHATPCDWLCFFPLEKGDAAGRFRVAANGGRRPALQAVSMTTAKVGGDGGDWSRGRARAFDVLGDDCQARLRGILR